MLVIDIFNSRRCLLEIGIVNTSVKPVFCSSDACSTDDTFIYEYGLIIDGKIPTKLGQVIHTQSDCGIKLVQSVLSEIHLKNLISFSEKIYTSYFINISVNRKKIIENIILKKDSSTGLFEFGLNSLNCRKKIGLSFGTAEFTDKRDFVRFLQTVVQSIINHKDIEKILTDRKKSREIQKYLLLAESLNF